MERKNTVGRAMNATFETKNANSPSSIQEGAIGAHAAMRQTVAAQAAKLDREFDALKNRNLVLLFDGTGQIGGSRTQSNVAKLWDECEKSSTQIVYYDPGVGAPMSLPAAGFFSAFKDKLHRLWGLALGQGVFEDIEGGYRFLVANYREGDRIYLFGFSRGAFTARAVAGLVHWYGLVYPQGESMLAPMIRNYFARDGDGRRRFMGAIRKNSALEHTPLARMPFTHFVGVWDTVESVGPTRRVKITNSGSVADRRIVHVRHALALHETRLPYFCKEFESPNFKETDAPRSFQQVWFAGDHVDVGGGRENSGRSNIAMQWMFFEAQAKGLRLLPKWQERQEWQKAANTLSQSPVGSQPRLMPLWSLVGLGTRGRGSQSEVHPSAQPLDSASLSTWSSRDRVIALITLLSFAGAGCAAVQSGLTSMDGLSTLFTGIKHTVLGSRGNERPAFVLSAAHIGWLGALVGQTLAGVALTRTQLHWRSVVRRVAAPKRLAPWHAYLHWPLLAATATTLLLVAAMVVSMVAGPATGHHAHLLFTLAGASVAVLLGTLVLHLCLAIVE
jgi:uncharacterized protein (DUF2235 family)